jgi:hypothetical protein
MAKSHLPPIPRPASYYAGEGRFVPHPFLPASHYAGEGEPGGGGLQG